MLVWIHQVPPHHSLEIPQNSATGLCVSFARVMMVNLCCVFGVIKQDNLREAVEIGQNPVFMTRLNTAVDPRDAHAIDVMYHRSFWTKFFYAF